MKRSKLLAAILVVALLVVAVSAGVLALAGQAKEAAAAPVAATAAAPLQADATVAALEGTLSSIYEQVSPSVVTVEVSGSGNNPFGSGGGLGSGFVWDSQGHIVTNNHVIDGAGTINVVFSDDTVVSAKVVGADPQSDLAVLQVALPDGVKPVAVGDSTKVKVGQLVIAIGNPFGEQSTMTMGIISALGRFLPVDEASAGGYTIPDVIQTDAPINPGNSGGVLLNAEGQVIGVPSAIESQSGSSAGIGFAIPAEVVKQVVPVLISKGSYEHPYLGISGASLTPDLAKAMNLPATQRGALVATVTAGGPAAAAGLQASTQNATIAGQQVQVGGDVITAIEGQPVKSFNDLVAYLAIHADVGQKVNLTVLRNGQQQTVAVTLGARPAAQQQQATTPRNTIPNRPNNPNQGTPNQGTPNQGTPNQGTARGAYLGIQGLTMTPDLAQAMSLDQNQSGVLVATVAPGTAAANGGLRGGSDSATIAGQQVPVGGDIIIAMNGQKVTTLQGLQQMLRQARSGDKATFTVLRNGQQTDLTVTLGSSQ